MDNQKNKLMTFITIILLLLLVGSYYQFIHPLRTKEEQTVSNLISLQQEFEMMAATTVEQPIDPYIKLDQIRLVIPEKPYEEHIIRDIRMAESTSGISISGIVPRVSKHASEDSLVETADSATSLAKPIIVNLTYSGNNEQAAAFIGAIENSNRLMHITSLNMKSVDQLSHIISCEMEITTYYIPDMKSLYDESLNF